jgi:hypothetical protein
MGRTLPSFRIALTQEETAWKQFRDALDVKNKAIFDRIFHIARLYISACMLSCRPVRIQPIMMAIVFHHYKQLQGIIRNKDGTFSKR